MHMKWSAICRTRNQNQWLRCMGQADPSESNIELKPTIEDIHDSSENENDTQNKTSMKNILYEPGKKSCMLNKCGCINMGSFITQTNLTLRFVLTMYPHTHAHTHTHTHTHKLYASFRTQDH